MANLVTSILLDLNLEIIKPCPATDSLMRDVNYEKG